MNEFARHRLSDTAITDKDAADLSAVVELADLVECRSCAILPTSHACSAS